MNSITIPSWAGDGDLVFGQDDESSTPHVAVVGKRGGVVSVSTIHKNDLALGAVELIHELFVTEVHPQGLLVRERRR
jgi:hypothetical protein